jgi:hypothetical protein
MEVRNPFGNDALDFTHVSRHSLHEIGNMLRVDPLLWRQIINDLPESVVGSMATELIVLLDGKHMPAITTGHVIKASLAGALLNQGVSKSHSYKVAAAALEYMHDRNLQTVHVCRTLSMHSTHHTMVIRIALKPVRHISMDPDTQRVFFRDGHANLVIINMARKIIMLIEPSCATVLPFLDLFIFNALLADTTRHEFTIMKSLPSLIASHDTLCTVWCAIFAAVILGNNVSNEEEFQNIIRWVHGRRPYLLRQFAHVVHSLLRVNNTGDDSATASEAASPLPSISGT